MTETDIERKLEAFCLEKDENGKGIKWFVVDLINDEVLCIAIKDVFNHLKMERKMLFEPIFFKRHQAAEKFINGEMTIGEIQEGLTELNVGFRKNII